MTCASIPARPAALGFALLLAVGLGSCGREASLPAPDRSAPVQAPRAPEPAPVREERVADEGAGAVPASLPSVTPPRDRMVHYDGNLELRATSPRQTIDEAVEITTAAGGYVETLAEGRVVLRVPAARFQEVFDRLVGLGDVLSRSVTRSMN